MRSLSFEECLDSTDPRLLWECQTIIANRSSDLTMIDLPYFAMMERSHLGRKKSSSA